MATLTAADYGSLRELVYTKGQGKEELQALDTLPNKDQLLAMFQAVEDRMAEAMTLALSDVEQVLGKDLGKDPEARARALNKISDAWKRRSLQTNAVKYADTKADDVGAIGVTP